MGLYGYVGYLAAPRATQDVDVLIADEELEPAVSAILGRWPALQVERQEVVVRFRDPGEIAITGEMMQVIDLMRPHDDCYYEILQHAHRVDASTGHTIPTIEAACASKFAALISPNRQFIKKQQDAVDLRSILVPNQTTLNRNELHRLGELVYQGGGTEILEMLELAIHDKPFPI
jgi:NADPH-dependent ferric siderophore reductase